MDDFPSFYTYLPLEQVTTLHIFAKKVIHFYKRLQTYEKHLIAWGILSTMFMANTFAQKDIDRPIMGWSSWNTYHVNISEELIKQQADALIKHGLKEAGYNYINIDDGFFGHRDETGKMHPHPDRFPTG